VLFQRLRLARLLHEQIQIGFLPTPPFKELEGGAPRNHYPVIPHHRSQRQRLLNEPTKESVNVPLPGDRIAIQVNKTATRLAQSND
jgi:hypothetical protein